MFDDFFEIVTLYKMIFLKMFHFKVLIKVMQLDLANLDSVKDFVRRFLNTEQRLDILINNAGLFVTKQSVTRDGFETTFQSNHLGPFLLTNLLLDKLKESNYSRIINVSSVGHKRANLDLNDLNFQKRKFNGFQAYFDSKLANILFSRELTKKLKSERVEVFSLHPGLVNTDILNATPLGSKYISILVWPFGKLIMKTPEQGNPCH